VPMFLVGFHEFITPCFFMVFPYRFKFPVLKTGWVSLPFCAFRPLTLRSSRHFAPLQTTKRFSHGCFLPFR